MRLPTPVLVALVLAPIALGGPIACAICETGCISLVVTCYATAGFFFSTIVGAPATPAVLLTCNAGLGVCSAACATVALFAPTP